MLRIVLPVGDRRLRGAADDDAMPSRRCLHELDVRRLFGTESGNGVCRIRYKKHPVESFDRDFWLIPDSVSADFRHRRPSLRSVVWRRPIRRRRGATAGATVHSSRGSSGLGMRYGAPEFELLDAVGAQDHGRDRLAGQFGQRVRRGEFHLLVDLRGPHVERTPEDVGEPQHVVDLVRVVRTARGEDDVGARDASAVS